MKSFFNTIGLSLFAGFFVAIFTWIAGMFLGYDPTFKVCFIVCTLFFLLMFFLTFFKDEYEDEKREIKRKRDWLMEENLKNAANFLVSNNYPEVDFSNMPLTEREKKELITKLKLRIKGFKWVDDLFNQIISVENTEKKYEFIDYYKIDRIILIWRNQNTKELIEENELMLERLYSHKI